MWTSCSTGLAAARATRAWRGSAAACSAPSSAPICRFWIGGPRTFSPACSPRGAAGPGGSGRGPKGPPAATGTPAPPSGACSTSRRTTMRARCAWPCSPACSSARSPTSRRLPGGAGMPGRAGMPCAYPSTQRGTPAAGRSWRTCQGRGRPRIRPPLSPSTPAISARSATGWPEYACSIPHAGRGHS